MGYQEARLQKSTLPFKKERKCVNNDWVSIHGKGLAYSVTGFPSTAKDRRDGDNHEGTDLVTRPMASQHGI